MDVIAAQKIIKLFPISSHVETNHRTVILHLPTPYEPPTFYNNVTLRRPDITTSPAPDITTPHAIVCLAITHA
jgi:hypothetical protein